MNSLTRVVIPLTIVFAVVGGVAYFSQYTQPVTPKAISPPPGSSNAPSLEFPEFIAIYDQDDPYYAREIERGSKGHYDFWGNNPHSVPATVWLRHQSCVCSDVQLGIVDGTAMANFSRNAPTMATAIGLFGPIGFDPTGLLLAPALANVEWQSLKVEKKVGTVPPANPQTGPRYCIVRLGWEGKNDGPLRLSADIDYSGGSATPGHTRFEVPVMIEPPIMVAPGQIPFGDIKAGDVLNRDIVIWTSVRDEVPFTMPDLSADPCLRLGTPQPLDPAFCSQRLREAIPNMHLTRVRKAYRIPLTLHENLDGHQLDLGPYTRTLTFNADYDARTVVTGRVRGEISVSSRSGDDIIKFGDFQADRPQNERATVIVQPGTQLRIVSKSPPALDAQLAPKKGTNASWDLAVTLPANSLTGPIPAGSHVMLETLGPNPRRVRIPVTGTAFLR